MFFNKPRINRIAQHLEITIAEICRNRWAYLLSLEAPVENLIYDKHCGDDIDLYKIVETPALFRAKEHFSWDYPYHDPRENMAYLRDNSRLQYLYYSNLLRYAKQINSELSAKEPNYETIIKIAHQLKNQETKVPSVYTAEIINIKVGGILKGNLFLDFFEGIIGIFYAPYMSLIGVISARPYCLGYSQYCGSPQFFLDTALYFCESVLKVVRSVIFPLGMLYSVYTTDSFNPFTKGDVERSLEGIIALAEQLKSTSQDLSLAVVPV